MHVFNYLFYSLIQVIRKFADQLEHWLKTALHNLPDGLMKIKLDRK